MSLLQPPPFKPNESLRNEIIYLLGSNLIYQRIYKVREKEFTLEVTFTVNNQVELIIIDMNAPHKTIEIMIKKKLNYKKVDFRATKKGEMHL